MIKVLYYYLNQRLQYVTEYYYVIGNNIIQR